MGRSLIRVAAMLAGLAGAAGSPAADSLPGVYDPGPYAAAFGAGDAPVVVAEFFDYRCPHCASHARDVFPEIGARFIATGQVRYLLVEALPAGDELAERDAAAARCAGDAGRYPQARAYLFGGETPLREGPLDLEAFARAMEIEPAALVFCVEAGQHLAAIRAAVAGAVAHRVEATPTFFFGFPVAGGSAMTVERHVVGEIGADRFGQIAGELIRSKRDAEARRPVDR